MDAAERWSRVSEILSEALDRPPTERDAFVAERIAREPTLRTEVLAMWEQLGEDDTFLERSPLEGPPPTADLGAYRIVGELGQGGMGVVHLAERSDGQFARRVAIKRIGRTSATFEALRRFTEERQILARLDHPNVTRLLDSGLDAAGVPYLVMEHVEGVPITAYCRQHAQSVRQRLGLFLRVCAAVQHAHQHLVIHRDIKPGNILVTADGEPKLLDFGIAKALGGPAADATRTAHPALTLDYASPEQVSGQAVTTASDVYSLGLLLFELLADRKAYELAEHSLAEGVRLVCELTPPAPSTVAPAERRAALQGDLDAIVAKATEKAPADRYTSVSELAGDVGAHLGDQPVRARRPSFGYVARKFVRRHRAGAIASVAALLLLAAGVAAIVWQARVAERERARAQRRFEEVQQLAHYVIFDLNDGVAKLPGSTELRRQMIERSLAYLDSLATEAAGDPRLQTELAEAYSRLGDVLGRFNAANLGDRAGALASYGKARDLLRQALATRPDDRDAQRGLAHALIKLHLAIAEPAQKTKAVEESMAIWERLAKAEPSEENLGGLASAHFSAFLTASRDPASMPHMERALELYSRLLAAKPGDSNRKRNVALCHKYMGAILLMSDGSRPVASGSARGLAHLQEAVRLDGERLAAEPHDPQAKLDYSFDLSVLGSSQVDRAEYADAVQSFERVLAVRRELVATDPANVQSRDRLADTLVRLGAAHVMAGQPRQGEPLLREALAIAENLAPEARTVGITVSSAHLFLGEVARLAGRDSCAWDRLVARDVATMTEPKGDMKGLFGTTATSLAERALARASACPGSS
jgi:eukaryotic-like serine/threonine-protein kinase